MVKACISASAACQRPLVRPAAASQRAMIRKCYGMLCMHGVHNCMLIGQGVAPLSSLSFGMTMRVSTAALSSSMASFACGTVPGAPGTQYVTTSMYHLQKKYHQALLTEAPSADC